MASYRKIGKSWHYRIVGVDGRQVSRKGCSDRRETERMAALAELEITKIKAGLVDPLEAQRRDHERAPVANHLSTWKASLVAKGNTPKHVDLFTSRALRTLDVAGVGRLVDLTADKVQAALARMKAEGASLATINHHRNAVRSFARWCEREGRIARNPLDAVTGYNASADPRHERRTLSPEELARVIQAAHEGDAYRLMSGPARALCYRLAVASGLRYGELRSLTARSFDLTGERPTVTVQAGYAKNRETATLPLPEDVAVDLRPYLSSVGSDAPAFPIPGRGADMLRVDLERAGVPYRDESGRVYDFHSLRCQLATLADRAGASPRTVQRMMRHSTLALTDRYTRPRAADLDAVAASLPTFRPPAPAEPLAATGTAGHIDHIGNRSFLLHSYSADGNSRNQSDSVVMACQNEHFSTNEKPLVSKGFDATGRVLSATVASSGGGTRTPDTRIMIPLETATQGASRKPLRVESEKPHTYAIPIPGNLSPDLAAVVDAWPSLPEAIRAGILAMVRAAEKGGVR